MYLTYVLRARECHHTAENFIEGITASMFACLCARIPEEQQKDGELRGGSISTIFVWGPASSTKE